VLFVFVLLTHQRRRIVHFRITEHPTAAWTAQQIIEAFPDDTAPRWLLRDRDAIYGDMCRRRVAAMGISEVISRPSSPCRIHMLESAAIDSRLSEMREKANPALRWDENCEGSARALVVFVGPSPGRHPDDKPGRRRLRKNCHSALWNESYTAPLGWSAGFRASFKPVVEALLLRPYPKASKRRVPLLTLSRRGIPYNSRHFRGHRPPHAPRHVRDPHSHRRGWPAFACFGH
jgi:hypothetical protein